MTHDAFLKAMAALAAQYAESCETEHAVDWLFDELLGRYTDADVAAFYQRLTTRLTPHRVRHMVMALLGHAVKEGTIVVSGTAMRRCTPDECVEQGAPADAVLWMEEDEDEDATVMDLTLQDGNLTAFHGMSGLAPLVVHIEIVEDETVAHD